MTPTETVNAFIAAIERKDVEAAIALVTDNVSYENMPMQPIVGPEAMAATLEMFLGPASEVEWPILRQFEVGNVVVNERLDRFRIGDGWLELPIAGVFEVVDGRISLWRDYFDMATYSSQMAELTSA
ncbi:MAG TPA: limonene-1,2-epoxide hydrolase family protein [Acidimicrobiales bacterium]|jgi:limonene-1,2-epoxide hydrolase|nr:limonene-1,2-epoxide hydrolase family protein [Acidimicrobiales bacterium]MDP6215385.1 limonene-1,2-epoxide hydrolase family protein [Acidimicrobiales bacterium]MDP7209166.1 limonene-1,2-epoxide hydrolase family protein [Acidimicrobiales bacterium]HJL90049.1 limonene-1,2-epoxide hydrolase family protein [Acidimicrobiales bacterium]HJO99276.1 limonene-1,2-epoxide hydrolase family protein [Acidimicrobiales bacterium]|tara:strand:+ start:2676 stop:3056 length:381 start_codon:yes stop_codon:yes gene_type:complete